MTMTWFQAWSRLPALRLLRVAPHSLELDDVAVARARMILYFVNSVQTF